MFLLKSLPSTKSARIQICQICQILEESILKSIQDIENIDLSRGKITKNLKELQNYNH